jgi:hypothetical protein
MSPEFSVEALLLSSYVLGVRRIGAELHRRFYLGITYHHRFIVDHRI